MATARKRLAVLISGRGSNMLSLAEACADPAFPAEIALVVSNDPAAPGLERAQELGLRTAALSHREFPGDREAHERAVDGLLHRHGIDLVCLAGYMRLLTPWFVEHWRDRLINIHPSLLPSFKGLDTHARALAEGVRWHGCSVHFVRAEMDAGPIIAQAAVPVAPGDSPDTLAARVLAAEHWLYSAALALVAEGRAQVRGNSVELVDAELPETVYNPPLRRS